jgi:hypothetical protein
MPVEFNGRCKVCLSPLRTEIEERMRRGESLRSISRWLEASGTPISHSTLALHRKEHFNFMEEALKRYEESKLVYEQGVDGAVQCLQSLSTNVSCCASLRDRVVELLQGYLEESRRPPSALVELFGIVLQEMRLHAQLLHQLRSSGPDVIVNILERVYDEIEEAATGTEESASG